MDSVVTLVSRRAKEQNWSSKAASPHPKTEISEVFFFWMLNLSSTKYEIEEVYDIGCFFLEAYVCVQIDAVWKK